MLELLLHLVAFGLIVAGVALWSAAAGLIVAGLLLLLTARMFAVEVERGGDE